MDDRDQVEREQIKALKARRRFLSVWTIVGSILLTGVLVYLMGILSVPVGIVVWSIIIVFCLRGPVNKLEKMGLNRAVATAISYVLMFVVLALVACAALTVFLTHENPFQVYATMFDGAFGSPRRRIVSRRRNSREHSAEADT